MQNDHLILVSGKSKTGKSSSLESLKDDTGVIYLNCENGKKLPFKHAFSSQYYIVVTDPLQVYQAIEQAEARPDVHTIIIDTLTYLMDMYESVYVLTSSNTMKAWGDYAQFMKVLMSRYVASSTKNIIFLAHTSDILNEAEMINETLVKVKGSLMNQGVESFFTNVISTKKLSISALSDDLAKSDMFTITEDEEYLGFKHVYQTRVTKNTVNERISSPKDMWTMNETYIDNNIKYVIDRLHKYYG